MELSSFIIDERTSVYDAADVINKNGRQIVFVCRGNRLAAVLSDGDIRRFILKNGDFSAPVREAANYNPISLPISRQHEAGERMKNGLIRAIPIVNGDNEIVSIEFFNNTKIQRAIGRSVPVVIMAGGKGARLAPYTDVLPKPLIPIGEKTITEHIISRFMAFGCRDFYMIINHKKELIKAYFSETALPCTLQFVEEREFLGTGGGLKLLEGQLHGSFFMTNCDILIDSDYTDILAYHERSQSILTMVCAMKKIQVPYGIIELNEAGQPQRLIEKPAYPLLTNTGFYVVEPAFLAGIKENTFAHMTSLIQEQIDGNSHVGTYPISETAWLDMGQAEEMERMWRRIEQ